ncbi:hypothetical protein ElyMa_001033000 [Elysia marginata]|uniref:Uncharacterized protein n=1 Tax=Elysia marginata TaxID=1093978 RepID=A0AAV4HNQ5_9GAST|nr:hypothetical protein ElyMa_001033000 [Elysia marginata]
MQRNLHFPRLIFNWPVTRHSHTQELGLKWLDSSSGSPPCTAMDTDPILVSPTRPYHASPITSTSIIRSRRPASIETFSSRTVSHYAYVKIGKAD